MTANVITLIDADGQLQKVNKTKTLTFHVLKEDGQWRINSAPSLTLLIKPVFDVIFQGYSIYFLDKPQQHLVPDVRWFPSRASTGTKMIAALLKGPSPWLAEAVTSAIPSGTKLNTNSVTVNQGVATVDLSAKALKASYYQKELMRAQIFETLSQLPSVLDVDVQIDRSPQQISSLNQLTASSPSNTAFAIIDRDLYEQSEFGSDLVTGFRDYIVKSAATDFAITEDQGQIAILNNSGVWTAFPHTRSAALKLIDSRPNLITPVIDSYQYIWSMASDAGHGIRVYNGSKNVAAFTPAWMRPLTDKRFAVSPDDARLIVTGYLKGQSVIYAVAISRDNIGLPRLAATPKLLGTRSAKSLDVNWVSATDLVISNYAEEGTQIPEQLTVGGESVNLPAFGANVRMAASADGQTVFLLTPTGDLYTNRNQGWVLLRNGVKAIHFAH